MCQGRGAYPCSTPVHDVFWGIINFTFHLHRLLFFMRHLYPENSEVRTTKIQRDEISFLYVENKTEVIKNGRQHKSGKHQAWLRAALKQMSSRYSKEVPATGHPREPDSMDLIPYNLTWSWCNGSANHHWYTGNCSKGLPKKNPKEWTACIQISWWSWQSKDLRRKPKEMLKIEKGCQTTDKQPFAVNKPFWQITVTGSCSKINKLHTDVIKVGTTPHLTSRKAEIHCKLQTGKRSQRNNSLKTQPCTAAGVTQKQWCLAQSSWCLPRSQGKSWGTSISLCAGERYSPVPPISTDPRHVARPSEEWHPGHPWRARQTDLPDLLVLAHALSKREQRQRLSKSAKR